MEYSLPTDLKNMLNINSDQFQSPQYQDEPPSPIQENDNLNFPPKNEDSRGVIEIPNTINKITKMQKNLDGFIQDCLNKYKPVEDPDPIMYTNTTTEEEKNLIISRKSTIPDLVIWNKNFNKNECFFDADTEKQSDFPRYRFYLRLGNKDKNAKNKN